MPKFRTIGPTGQSGEAVKHRHTDTFVNNIYGYVLIPILIS